MLADRQATFSLEKCIANHGLEDGTKIWKTRQDKWQETLQANPDIVAINKSKDSSSFDYFLKKSNYNSELATILYNKYSKCKDSSSFNWALDKCNGDEDLAKKLYITRNTKKYYRI